MPVITGAFLLVAILKLSLASSTKDDRGFLYPRPAAIGDFYCAFKGARAIQGNAFFLYPLYDPQYHQNLFLVLLHKLPHFYVG